MGIQINGQTDTISAVDGSITVATDLTVPGALTYDDVTNIDSVGVVTARNGLHVTSGNIGIGTDNPTQPLTIVRSSADQGDFGLRLQYTNTNGPTNTSSAILVGSYGLKFKNYNNSRDFIFETGSVGIGTDNPGSNKLQVQGSSAFYGNGGASATWGDTSYLGALSFDGSAQPVIRAASGKALIFQVNQSTEALRITSAGDFYLNRTSQLTDAKLSVQADDGEALIAGQMGTTTGISTVLQTYNSSGNISSNISVDNSNRSLILKGANTEGIRVTSAGGVGIGTDTPYVNNSFNSLSIGGSGKYGLIELNKSDGVAGSWIDVYGTNGNGDLRITTAGTSGAITFWTGGSFTEKLRITSDGKVSIGGFNPAVAGLSISNSSTNRGFEFDTGSGFDSTSCIRAYDRPTTAYKSLGLTGSDIKFGINDVEKVRISSSGLAVNKNAAADTDIEIVQSADPTLRLYDTRNAAYKADFIMAGSGPLIRNNNTTASDRTLTVQKGLTDHLVIHGGGQVATPLQPRFFATRGSTYTGYNGQNTGGTWIAFNNTIYNVGSGFQTSGSDQGRFVAPVSGLYLFHATAYKGTGTADWTQSWFDVDGSRANGTDFVHSSTTRFAQNAIQVYMTAGQKIGFHPYNNQTNNEIISTGNHTWFKGCLLG